MTDRGKQSLDAGANHLRIGPSSLHWDGTSLTIDVEEWGALPMVTKVKGCVTITPSAITDVELPLTPDGAHVWRPFAPVSDIKVDLDAPGWQWDGHGYLDGNFGIRALEQDLEFWTWGRFPTSDGAVCVYDAKRLDGSKLTSAFEFTRDGQARQVDLPPARPFKRSFWRIYRETRSDPGTQIRETMNILDAPFYSRSAVETTLNGETVTGVHEALDLSRFRSPFVKPMLAFRVPRWR